MLLAIGLPHEIAHGSLRLTLSEENTKEEIDITVAAIAEIVEKIEAIKLKVKVFAGVDTMEFLYRGGRVSKATAAIGELANLALLLCSLWDKVCRYLMLVVGSLGTEYQRATSYAYSVAVGLNQLVCYVVTHRHR